MQKALVKLSSTLSYLCTSSHKNYLWWVYVFICSFSLFKSIRGKIILKLLRICHSAQNKIHGCIFMRKNSITSSFLLFKWVSCHIEISILVILSKPGENKHLGLVTQSTAQIVMNWFVQAAHTEMAQVCTGVQVTMRILSLLPLLQKLSSLFYLMNVTLLALNWHGYKSWEVWGTPEQICLQ